jgi:hypothetical protein
MKSDEVPGPGGTKFHASMKKAFSFDFKIIPLGILLLVGAYISLVKLGSTILFYVFFLAIFGLILYSRWLGYAMMFRGAQYTLKSVASMSIQRKRRNIRFLFIIFGVLFCVWYVLLRETPKISQNKDLSPDTTLGGFVEDSSPIFVPIERRAGWEIYRNDSYRFAFQYPKNVELAMIDNLDSLVINLKSEDFFDSSASIRVSSKVPDSCDRSWGPGAGADKIQISGAIFTRVLPGVFSASSDQRNWLELSTGGNGHCYVLLLKGTDNNILTTESLEVELFSDIASSFLVY